MCQALTQASRAGIFIILYRFETVEMRFENANFLKVLIYYLRVKSSTRQVTKQELFPMDTMSKSFASFV